MNILITGARGQLGAELTALLEGGVSPLGGIPGSLRECRVIAADADMLDITDQAAVRRFIDKRRPRLVVNCAAKTNVDRCETEADEAMRVNALGPRYLAEACADTGAELVQVSTDYVFPGDASAPYAEWDVCGPTSMYGKSKLLGEQYVRESGCRCYIVRTAWLYGRTGRNFVRTVLRVARERGALQVVNDQRGSPTNAADLAWHILRIADSAQYGVYHVTGGGECSWYEFACEIVRLSGLSCTVTPCTSDEYPSPVKRPAYSALEHRMLRCTVGDRMRPWQEALADFMVQIAGETP